MTDSHVQPNEVPECLACGACCHSSATRYVRVYGDDYARLGEDAERWVNWIGNEAYMTMVDGRCSALQVEPGRFVCAIYPRRPETCRALERGGAACESELLDKRHLTQKRG